MPAVFKMIQNIFVGFYNGVASGLVYIGAVLIVFMMLSIGASVLFRQMAFDFAWALEVSEYILIIITLFGSGYLIKKGGHVRVDILTIYLYGRTKLLYNALIFTIVALVSLAFTIIGAQTSFEAYLTGTLEIKVYLVFQKWLLLALFPLAGFVMFIEAGKLALKHWMDFFSGRKPPVDRTSEAKK